MREATLDRTIKSDVDLTKLASRRVSIVQVSGDEYRITSTLSFYSSERNEFVSRYLRRRKPGIAAFSGNASAPTGYFWKEDALKPKLG